MSLTVINHTTGRKLVLQTLVVGESYACLLEGIPSEEITGLALQDVRKTAARSFSTGAPIHVIGPPLVTGRHGEQRLPPTFVCGEFVSFDPAADASKQASMLSVIWFQNDFPPILSPENERLVAEIPWNQLAADFDW